MSSCRSRSLAAACCSSSERTTIVVRYCDEGTNADCEAIEPDDPSTGLSGPLIPAGGLEFFQTATSEAGLPCFLFGVNFFWGDKLRDLLRGEPLRIGEIGAVGFKIDFTNGPPADFNPVLQISTLLKRIDEE